MSYRKIVKPFVISFDEIDTDALNDRITDGVEDHNLRYHILDVIGNQNGPFQLPDVYVNVFEANEVYDYLNSVISDHELYMIISEAIDSIEHVNINYPERDGHVIPHLSPQVENERHDHEHSLAQSVKQSDILHDLQLEGVSEETFNKVSTYIQS